MKKGISIFICLCTVLLSACSFSILSNSCTPMEDAPQNISSKIQDMHNQVIQAIEINSSDTILAMSGEQIKNNSAMLKDFLSLVNASLTETPNSMGAYYLTFSNTGSQMQTMSPSLDDTSYHFYVQPLSKEMAVIFTTFTKDTITFILAEIYAKSDVWRLEGLKFTDYAYNGMNAPDFYKAAVEYQKTGQLIPAGLYASLLTDIMQPADMISYSNTQEMVDFQNSVFGSIDEQYIFPISFNTQEGSYQITTLEPRMTDQGLTCILKYVTNTPLNNTVQLTIEASAIMAVADEYFPGYTESMDAYIVQAFNEIPSDPNKMYNSYSIEMESSMQIT